MRDRVGFEGWYRQEHPALVRALWAISGDRDMAADLVDEAFSRALARWSRVSVMDSPAGWVRTTAVNLHRRAMRRRAIEERILRSRHASVADVAPNPSLDPDLWAAVRGLPLRQREVVVLRYVDDRTEAEIADILGVSPGAASASLVKARRQLASVLAPEKEVSPR